MFLDWCVDIFTVRGIYEAIASWKESNKGPTIYQRSTIQGDPTANLLTHSATVLSLYSREYMPWI